MAPNEVQAEASLSELIHEQKESTIKEIVRSKLRVSLSQTDSSHNNQEALDLVTDVQTTILSSLRNLKHGSSSKAIADFGGYVATMTYNACHQLLRRKYPKRFQLKNKLRYLLSHDAKFALWQTDNDWLCGLAAWRGAKRSTIDLSNIEHARQKFKGSAPSNRQDLIDLISKTFELLTGPILLDEFVSLVFDQLQIREDVMVEEDASEKSSEPDSLIQLESRGQLEALWKEICDLPLRHRIALLLNLRDRRGADALELFHLTRVAGIREIAKSLDFQPEEFASIWNKLPLDDAAIADHLGLKRQQVINLRQSARARLARRLKFF